MDKYYTPDISEFHVGFEYEVYIGEKEIRSKEVFYLNNSHIDLVNHKLYNDKVRIKYLDQEDLESLGWKANHHSYGVNYIKDNYTLSWIYDKIRIEISHEKEGRFFVGEIKNKSELRRIMKQIQILNEVGE